MLAAKNSREREEVRVNSSSMESDDVQRRFMQLIEQPFMSAQERRELEWIVKDMESQMLLREHAKKLNPLYPSVCYLYFFTSKNVFSGSNINFCVYIFQKLWRRDCDALQI